MAKNNSHLYFGKAGELFIASEFMVREWNVAFPQLDRGVDSIVIDDGSQDTIPIQVKSANAVPDKKIKNTFKATFKLPDSQIKGGTVGLRFALVFRHENKWANFVLIIKHDQLAKAQELGQIYQPDEKGYVKVEITFSYDGDEIDEIRTGAQKNSWNLKEFVNAYPTLPSLSALKP